MPPPTEIIPRELSDHSDIFSAQSDIDSTSLQNTIILKTKQI